MRTILVVDDEPAIVEVLREVLEDEGYHVVIASNGDDALASLAEVRPDLIVCDVMMPGMDGRAMCRAIQADARYRSIPMVLMSAAAAPDATDGCTYAAFLPKPFDLDTLVGLIAAVLDGAPASRTRGTESRRY